MKVVMSTPYAYPFSHYGGAEKYVYCLSKHLVRLGCDVKIMLARMADNKPDQYYDGIKYEFIALPIPQYQKRAWVYQYLFISELAKRLRAESFDVLHAFHITPYYYLHLKERKPVVIEPFGLARRCEVKARLFEGMARWLLLKKPLIYCGQHAEAIAAEGEIQAGEFSRFFKVSKDKIFTLSDGVDLKHIQGLVKDGKKTRADLGLDKADLVLMNVNRLDRNKGVPHLIMALKILNETLDARLIMVGSGIEEDNIKRQIDELNLADKVIHFKDIPDEELYPLYSLADISVTPTLWEGLPLVVLEAMAAGKPIVATRVADIPSVVDGNGIVVEPADTIAIAKAVMDIHGSGKAEAMGRRSLEIIRDYDWSTIAEKALAKYRELIG